MVADLSKIEGLLATRIGLDPVSVGSPLILRAAQRRMNELGLIDVAAYERCLRLSESELQSLVEEVVVSESWFFRDERPFQRFREHVCAYWQNDTTRPPLRVLSLPCAGGEEPYSIAMTLYDLGLSAHRFQIDAVDVSAHRLEIARRGVYSANAFRSSDLGFRSRHFRDHPLGYELDPAVRSTVHFRQANVLSPALLEDSPPYDVVFCRNLLIYLGAAARTHLLAVIERLLKADGLLFIGHADRLDIGGLQSKFTVSGDPACFVYRLKTHSDDASLRSLPLDPAWLDSRLPLPGEATFVPASSRPLLTASIAPEMGTDSGGIAPDSAAQGDEPPLLAQAAELANQGRFDDAIKVCEHHLRVNAFSPPAYYLMGMICQAAGNRRRTEECFHKTVYLDPMHDEALLALALLAERRGDLDAALAFRRRAERSLSKLRKRVD